MPVVAIAGPENQDLEDSKIRWLMEDIWVYDTNKGLAELEIECILEAKVVIQKIEIFIVHPVVGEIVDLTDAYKKTGYENRYPKCWLDVYEDFKVMDKTLILNDLQARILSGNVITKDTINDVTIITVEFKSPLNKGESGIFRLGIKLGGLTRERKLPFNEKKIALESYGIATFGGTLVSRALDERWINYKNQIMFVEKQIIHLKMMFFNNCIEIVKCHALPVSEHIFGKCECKTLDCIPIKEISKATNKETEYLKDGSVYYMKWEFTNLCPTKCGHCINFSYFNSEFQKWLSGPGLNMFSLVLAILSVILAILSIGLAWITFK